MGSRGAGSRGKILLLCTLPPAPLPLVPNPHHLGLLSNEGAEDGADLGIEGSVAAFLISSLY